MGAEIGKKKRSGTIFFSCVSKIRRPQAGTATECWVSYKHEVRASVANHLSEGPSLPPALCSEHSVTSAFLHDKLFLCTAFTTQRCLLNSCV